MSELPAPLTPTDLLLRLCDVLHYDGDVGIFTWKTARGSKSAGARAGCICPHGYVQIRIFRRLFYAHRLAVAFVSGVWPEDEIDHRNGERSDNRICNLREAGKTRNMQNMKCPAHNVSGIKGVGFARREGKWRARIKVEGCEVHLGYFEDKSEAASAYASAAVKFFGEFARLS